MEDDEVSQQYENEADDENQDDENCDTEITDNGAGVGMELGIMNRPDGESSPISSPKETKIDIPASNNSPENNIPENDSAEKQIRDILNTQINNEEEVIDTLDMIENYKTEDNDRSGENLVVSAINAYQTDNISRNIAGLNNKKKLYKPMGNMIENLVGDMDGGGEDYALDADVEIESLINFNFNLKPAGFDSIMSGFKIVFSHFQVITSFNTFNLEWPPLFTELKNKFGFLNVDFYR